MKKLCTLASILASLAAFLPNAAISQARPTASKSGSVQAGVAGMYLDNDYSVRHNAGPVVYGDYDFLHLFYIDAGLEAEARFGGIYSPDDIGENSYLIGPRLSVRRANLKVYAKVLVGRGTIFHNSISDNTSSSFNDIAYGGGLEYRVKQRFNVRVIDAELQKWLNFYPHILSPFALSAGVAYIIR